MDVSSRTSKSNSRIDEMGKTFLPGFFSKREFIKFLLPLFDPAPFLKIFQQISNYFIFIGASSNSGFTQLINTYKYLL